MLYGKRGRIDTIVLVMFTCIVMSIAIARHAIVMTVYDTWPK